jgi:hypothetical protein
VLVEVDGVGRSFARRADEKGSLDGGLDFDEGSDTEI